jgi:hypothetical protein
MLSVLPELPGLNPCESGVRIGSEAVNPRILCGDVFPVPKSSICSRWHIAALPRASDRRGFSSPPARLSLCLLS